jgi:hypothetical protein
MEEIDHLVSVFKSHCRKFASNPDKTELIWQRPLFLSPNNLSILFTLKKLLTSRGDRSF